MFKKLRLWLIKKLNATPNDILKPDFKLSYTPFVVKPISMEFVKLTKCDLPIDDDDFVKSQIIDTMAKHIKEHLVFSEHYGSPDTLRVTLYVADKEGQE